MNDKDKYRDRIVVEHNDLIRSTAKMHVLPLKIYELAISEVNMLAPEDTDGKIILSKKKIFEALGASDNERYHRLKEVILDMQNKTHVLLRIKKKRGYEFRSIVPIPTVVWNDYDDNIEFYFSREIIPYIAGMTKNFSRLNVKDIMEMKNRYGIIIYKRLVMEYNQYEHYKYRGNRTQKQIDEYKNPFISIQELREITDTTERYKRTYDFIRKVITPAVEDINKNSYLSVSFETKKEGRRVVGFKFAISAKNIAPNMVSQERIDRTKELREKGENELMGLAVTSPYTKLLMDKGLLLPADMINKDVMIGLAKNVYPKYDELKALKGITAVEEHLDYVGSKSAEAETEIHNIAKYLNKAITQYIPRVKIEMRMEKGLY